MSQMREYSTYIPHNPNIGDKAVVNGHCCIWATCSVCGNARWVRTKHGGMPLHELCVVCNNQRDEKREASRLRELGRKHSLERIEKNRRNQLGKKLSEDTKKKLSQKLAGRKYSDETKRRMSLACKGRKLSEDTKRKISLANQKKYFKDDGTGQLCFGKSGFQNYSFDIVSKRRKERWARAGHNVILQDRGLKEGDIPLSLGEIGDIVIIHNNIPLIKVCCEICGEKQMWTRITKGKPRSTRCSSCASREMWKQYPYIFGKSRLKKWQESMKGSIHMRPNNAEKHLFSILCQLYPGQWAFVGDWSMILAGKNPDFVNRNGKKLIIELFGDYWHQGENPQVRIDTFARYGFRTLVIWESELKKPAILTDKIRKFVG